MKILKKYYDQYIDEKYSFDFINLLIDFIKQISLELEWKKSTMDETADIIVRYEVNKEDSKYFLVRNIQILTEVSRNLVNKIKEIKTIASKIDNTKLEEEAERINDIILNMKNEIEILNKENNELSEIIKNKVIPVKGITMPELAEFYINLAKRIKAMPSLRDLEKGSDINKDKWRLKIFNDVEFVLAILGRLYKEKENINQKIYSDLIDKWTEKYKIIQNREMKYKKISKAKEYNDGYRKDEDKDSAIF